MKKYDKPSISVTCYNAVDDTNALKLVTSAAIAPYTDTGMMSKSAFKIYHS